MNRIAIMTGLALALSLGSASAAEFQQRTDSGVGLFDQGGELYNHETSGQANDSAAYGYPELDLDRTPTASIGSDAPVIWSPAVPADVEHNERGQGMFDSQL